MLLFWMELFLFVGMCLLAWFLSAHLQVSLQLKEEAFEKGAVLSGTLLLYNGAFLPVSDCCILLEYQNPETQKMDTLSVHSSILPKKEVKVPFEVTCRHCRILQLSVKKVLVWDYLQLFRIGKQTSARTEILVLPPGRELPILRESDAYIWKEQEHSFFLRAVSEPENFDFRQYREGDDPKTIHWKLYARTDDLWVRTYQAEKVPFLTFFLDFYSFRRTAPDCADAFWEIFTAICFGLLRQEISCFVCWYDFAADEFKRFTVENQSDYKFLMRQLYQLDGVPKQSLSAYLNGMSEFLPDTFLCLDGNLLVTYQREPQIQFTSQTCQEELKRGRLIL